MSTTVPPRSEIPVEYTWDASSVFASDTDWEAEIATVQSRVAEIGKYRGRFGEGPQVVADFFGAAEAIMQSVGKIFVYTTMFHAVDALDQQATAMRDRAQSLSARAQAAMAFGEPELLALGEETLRNWGESEPALQLYRQHFDRLLRRAAHIRSSEVEELLRQAQEPFSAASATHGILTNADMSFGHAEDAEGNSFEIAQGTIGALITHADREVRRTGWTKYADAHLALGNTMANCLAAGVKQDVFVARARRYGSSLEAALESNYIPVEVFHNLIATYRKHLPTWHRYWAVRQKALGYDKLHVYDTRAPLGEPVQVPYRTAVDWICDGMQPLGAEYVTAMRKGLLEERWVDVYPNKGKRAGAFSMGVKGTHPFIMMSYNDDIYGMSTLAHELGHSMHSYYTRREQPFVYANYGLFVAEVASNFNQAMVRAHLFKAIPERNFQIALIEEAMSNFHRYFFIMPTLARFELEIHERAERGQALTATVLNNLMADFFAEGYGDGVEMDRERVGCTWAQFSTHLYSNFYVYQYATGIAGAHALCQGILDGKPGAVERYLDFLKAGSSRYPLDVLRHAGVDLTTPEAVEATFGVLAGYVERLEELVG